MSADFFFVSKCQQICFSSANVSKLDSRQQTSEDVSITIAFVLEKTLFRHHMSENVSRFEFRQQTSANSFFVSGCQQICLFVSKCQQNDDDAGITSLAPARHRTEMIFASGQREFDLDSRLSVYCRTFQWTLWSVECECDRTGQADRNMVTQACTHENHVWILLMATNNTRVDVWKNNISHSSV